MMLRDQKLVMLMAPDYEDLEHWVVYMRLMEEGADLIIVGTEGGQVCRSKSGGLTAVTDCGASELEIDEIDGVMVPGGWAPDRLRRDPGVLSLVQGVHDAGGIIGMICHGGWVGASAGIVNGRRCTGSLGIRDDMINAGGEWVDLPALRDGNLVFGRVVRDIPHYCRELVHAIARRRDGAASFEISGGGAKKDPKRGQIFTS